MKLKHHILITGAGTVVGQGLIKCLKFANSRSDEHEYVVTACDMSENATGMYRAHNSVLVPPANSPSYIESILDVCKRYEIEAIMIGTEEELEPLSKNYEKIRKESDALVITNPLKVLHIARDKWSTFEFLTKEGFGCAASALPEDQDQFIKKHKFPMVVKPREGHGSLYFSKVDSSAEIKSTITAIENHGWRPILQEYLGEEDAEYTVGVVVDSTGTKVLSSIPMRKILRHGQTYKAFIENNQKVRRESERISLAIGARGPINIQGKLCNGKFKVFEINPRFSATLPIRAVAGINEPDITFKNFCLGIEEKANDFEEMICFRYLNEVYIPKSEHHNLKDTREMKRSNSFTVDYF